MRHYAKLGIYLSGISCFFIGAAGFLFPLFSRPWPQILMVAGLVLINIGLFILGQSVTSDRKAYEVNQRPLTNKQSAIG